MLAYAPRMVCLGKDALTTQNTNHEGVCPCCHRIAEFQPEATLISGSHCS